MTVILKLMHEESKFWVVTNKNTNKGRKFEKKYCKPAELACVMVLTSHGVKGIAKKKLCMELFQFTQFR